MSNVQHSSQPREEDSGVEDTKVEPRAVPRTTPRSSHLSTRRRNIWFLLIVLLLGVVTIVALGSGGARPSGQANVTQSTTPQPLTGTGEFREYPLPQSDSQMMRPATDHEGRIWFGEMGRNFLAVFDPRSQAFQQMTPPRGHYGVMSVQVASDDTIWFVEQYANYIGHYFPTTGHYQVYPLPMLSVPDPSHAGKTLTLPSAPNELVLDAHGTVWFTEFNADALGRLDPHTGLMRHYPLSARRSVQKLIPYGVTVDQEGMIWFTEVNAGRIGRLDPVTGRIHLFTSSRPELSPMEIASDAQGNIWVTSFSGPGTGGLYGLIVTPTGEIWVTVLAENVVARLDVVAHRFIYYAIPTPGSEPLGIVTGVNHTLWFTEVDKIGMLRP